MPTSSRAPQDVLKRYALISAGVAAVPAAVIAVLIVTGGGPSSVPVTAAGPAKVEAPAATGGASSPAAPEKEEVSHIEKMRALLEEICKAEDRMTGRVQRVLDEEDLTDRNRMRLLSELAIRAGRTGVSESSEMLDAAYLLPPGELRIALYSGVLQTRGEANPEEALKLCGVLRDQADQQMARRFVARFWALRDMAAAANAVEHLDFPEVRVAGAEGLLEAAREHPEEGRKLLARKDLNAEVAMTLVPSFAAAWPGRLDDLKAAVPSSRVPQVMSQLMAGYALKRPLEVLPYLAANPGVAFRADVITEMARASVKQHGGQALEKMLSAGDFPQRKDLIPATFSQWLSADLKSAGDWLKKEEGGIKDPALGDRMKELLVYRMKSAGATESAMAWAGKITDEGKREKVLKDLEGGG